MDELFEPSGDPGDYADDGGIQVKNQRIRMRGVFSPNDNLKSCINLCPNLINLSRVFNPPKTGFN